MNLARTPLPSGLLVLTWALTALTGGGCGPAHPETAAGAKGCPNALAVTSARGVRGVVLPSAVARRALMLRRKDVEDFWVPSEDDVVAVETGLREAVRERLAEAQSETASARRDADIEALKHIVSNFDRYLRQYAGVVIGGSRRVLVNAFPDDAYCWRDEFVAIDDGGAWFWTIQYDPKLHQYLHWELARK